MGMTNIVSKLCGLAAGAVVAAGLAGVALAQGAAPPAPAAPASGPSGGSPTGYQQTGNDANAAGPSGATRPLEVPVLYVTGIEILHSAVEPKIDIIRVTGLASSAGWSAPQLVPFFYGKPADDILDLQFIATSPEQSQKAAGFVPVSATFVLEAGSPFKGVRVRAFANALEIKTLTGTASYQVKASDCKDCIGKKYVEKGAQPAAGTVRAEDLPPDARPIAPTHGVKGDIHNPNRINLILDADNKIVMAFWE
jgi:hypothetical protein